MVGLEPIDIPGCSLQCGHEWQSENVYSTRTRNTSTKDSFTEPGPENVKRLKKARWTEHEWCTKCGGWRGGLGSEPTIEMYVGHMVLICREVARVLRKDGTFWLNISDSYNGSGGAGGDYAAGGTREGQPKYPGRSIDNLQEGDLIFAPARLALALQADGWIVRRDVIWSKNAMPEPRKGWRWQKPPCDCVKKQREAHIAAQMEDQGIDDRHRVFDKAGTKFITDPNCPNCKGTGRLIDRPDVFIPESWRHTASHEYVYQLVRGMHYFSDHTRVATETGANPRDVVEPSRTNYAGKHFAVFPPELIAPLIQASVPKNTCSICAKPWAPVLELIGTGLDSSRPNISQEHLPPNMRRPNSVGRGNRHAMGQYKIESKVIGYRPTCDCPFSIDENSGPGWVLDPFMGSGTTGLVAKEFGVNFVGTDVSFAYLDEQAKVRTGLGTPSNQLDNLPLLEEIKDA